MAKIPRHVELGDVRDCAGKFNPGRPAADDDEVQGRMRSGLHHLPLRKLKCEQNASANLKRVFHSLEAGSDLRPVILAKVGVSRAGRENQIIEFKFGA